MVSLVFACGRSRTRWRRSRHRGSERLRLGEIRCRGAVIAEHEFNFGAIPIGEREICSECDAAVEVIPSAVQIAELSPRETAFIENVASFGSSVINVSRSTIAPAQSDIFKHASARSRYAGENLGSSSIAWLNFFLAARKSPVRPRKNLRRWPRAPRVWLCRQRPAWPLLQALLLMRRSHLHRRFRPRKTGHFRSCITRSRLEQRTKIGSCASPRQQQRRSDKTCTMRSSLQKI